MPGKKKTLLGKINNLFPTCMEITMLVIKEQETELTRMEKMKLFFHANVICKFCKLFRIQSAALHQHIHSAVERSASSAPEFTLSEQKKSEMQAAINKSGS